LPSLEKTNVDIVETSMKLPPDNIFNVETSVENIIADNIQSFTQPKYPIYKINYIESVCLYNDKEQEEIVNMTKYSRIVELKDVPDDEVSGTKWISSSIINERQLNEWKEGSKGNGKTFYFNRKKTSGTIFESITQLA
jgi:hypothetical protein